MFGRQSVKLKSFALTAIVLLLLNCASQVDSKKYGRCELSRELVEKYKINKTYLSNCKYNSPDSLIHRKYKKFVGILLPN